MGGDPPDEDRSELLGGDRERLSGIPPVLSSHCCIEWRYEFSELVQVHHCHERTEGKAAREALFLSGDGFMPRGLYCD